MAREVGGPGMRENIRPLLAGIADDAEVIASAVGLAAQRSAARVCGNDPRAGGRTAGVRSVTRKA